ncbi:type II secretion system F family protein [Achromobacter xylosoxidans]|uniref:type II secretion system F family protein n=1 Tax=Achromobacter anxifer TaxID=1287737 RepID=UPI00155D4A33|nr:type II secretion system F family protein [Achromobacter anxifer]CAB5514526.1 hypothetical protein LMG26857_03585 [Achromobacter anxifer]
MKTFKAKHMVSGRTVETVLSAPTREDAERQARRMRGQLLSLNSSGGGPGWSRMSLEDRLVFFQRLASMLSSKVGVSEALGIIYQSFTGTVREASRILRDRIEAGDDLPDALEAAGPRYFPDVAVAIIRTGARGGDLAYAIREAARFERELSRVKKESGKGIWSALMGFVAGVVTILGSTMYVAPMIMKSSLVSISGDGVNVGWIMSMANVVTWIAVAAAIIVGGLFTFGVVLRPLAPAAVDRVIAKIPYYRDMVMAKSNYMVFFGLAVLLKAGLRVEEALKLTIEGAPKGELRNDLERALKAIVKGTVRPWPYEMHMLHPTDKAALATAQDREQTARTIEELAIQYQNLYRSRLETFVPVVQGFSAIFLSLAGFVLFGVSVVPLLQSTSSIMNML